jgi:hypothetical protein
MNTQEKEYKRVIELIMRKDKWFNHYRLVGYSTDVLTHLELTQQLENEIYILLGGLPKLEIGDIIRTWGRENLSEKFTNEIKGLGVLYYII